MFCKKCGIKIEKGTLCDKCQMISSLDKIIEQSKAITMSGKSIHNIVEDELSKKTNVYSGPMQYNNLFNYYNAMVNMNAMSFKVISAKDCCELCAKKYGNGTKIFDILQKRMLPPLHDECRCVGVFSTKSVEESNK